MKKRFFSSIFLLSLLHVGFSQPQANSEYKGIRFEEGLSWSQIKEKAKNKNKYIFVDCFATWCVPCKLMDKNVYTNDTVGQYVNDKFISVKVQFDKTKRDNEFTRSWYNDAESLLTQYKLTAYPTYLFFAPDGKIIHRELGAREFPKEFIEVVKSALDPTKQYYTLLADYQTGKKHSSVMMDLARATARAGDNELAAKIANDYLRSLDQKELFTKDNQSFMAEFSRNPEVLQIAKDYKVKYLDKLNQEALFTVDNLDFISRFPSLANSQDGFFKLFYKRSDEVDNLMKRKGFAEGSAKGIIRKEEIIKKIYRDGKPITNKVDWKKINATITQKYSKSYADAIVPQAQLQFFSDTKNWEEFARFRDKMIKTIPPKKADADIFDPNASWMLNMDAWNVFLHCSDKKILSRALVWVELAIHLENPNPDVQYLDTKANIFYKLGRIKEAIALEEIAINTERQNAIKAGREPAGLFDDFETTLDKMKKGDPTWSVPKKN